MVLTRYSIALSIFVNFASSRAMPSSFASKLVNFESKSMLFTFCSNWNTRCSNEFAELGTFVETIGSD
jgi:hypothetical protein